MGIEKKYINQLKIIINLYSILVSWSAVCRWRGIDTLKGWSAFSSRLLETAELCNTQPSRGLKLGHNGLKEGEKSAPKGNPVQW